MIIIIYLNAFTHCNVLASTQSAITSGIICARHIKIKCATHAERQEMRLRDETLIWNFKNIILRPHQVVVLHVNEE